MRDAHALITLLCDADMRTREGLTAYSSQITLWEVAELYVNYEMRKVALPGDPSKKSNCK